MNVREYLKLVEYYEEDKCTLCKEDIEHSLECPIGLLENAEFRFYGWDYDDRIDYSEDNLEKLSHLTKEEYKHGELYIQFIAPYVENPRNLKNILEDKRKKKEEEDKLFQKQGRIKSMNFERESLERQKEDLKEEAYTRKLNDLRNKWSDVWY